MQCCANLTFESHPVSLHKEQTCNSATCEAKQKHPTDNTHPKCKLTQLHVKPYQNPFLSLFLVFLPSGGIMELTLAISPSSGSCQPKSACLSLSFPQLSAIKTRIFISTTQQNLQLGARRVVTPPSGITEMFSLSQIEFWTWAYFTRSWWSLFMIYF